MSIEVVKNPTHLLAVEESPTALALLLAERIMRATWLRVAEEVTR
jgi:hypothetical protein